VSVSSVPLDDRGLLLGDGLFETLLWRAGALVLADEHHERMTSGASALGLDAPTLAEFSAQAAEAVRAAGLAASRAAVRVTLTAGSGGRGLGRPEPTRPRLFATAAAAPPPQTSARLIVSSLQRNPGSLTSRFKTLSYVDGVAARREAALAGADEAVMLNPAGHVASATAANLFWIEDTVVHTPAPETGCLPGTVAAQVRAAARRLGLELREVHASPVALAAADAIFLTNSLIGVRPAHIGPTANASHALIERLAAAVAAYV